MITIKIRKTIEDAYTRYHKPEYLCCDPLCWVRRFIKEDTGTIEIAGLVASCLSYGQVGLIQKCLNLIADRTGKNLQAFSLDTALKQKFAIFKDFKYRLNTGMDVALLFDGAGHIMREYGSIGRLLSSVENADNAIQPLIGHLVNTLRNRAYQAGKKKSDSFNHLLPDPALGGACKRLCMYFRWMVRPDDGIDLGLWKHINPSRLIIPVDTHIGRIAKSLKLTKRITADWKMAVEITESLKTLSLEDPVKYDFSLCQAGMAGEL